MDTVLVPQALNLILQDVEETSSELVPLTEAVDRILAEDVKSRLTNPPFDTSAMDGYALHQKDIQKLPVNLKIVGEARAGSSYRGTIHTGECVRIFTGAPIPFGTNHVVIQEDTHKIENTIQIKALHSLSSNIRERGGDFQEGGVLLKKGCKLGPRTIMLAAAMGHPVVSVQKKPRIAIIATGDELVEPGQAPKPDQIISSNSYGLLSLIKSFGAEGIFLGIAQDDEEVLHSKFLECNEADVIVSSGGVSVGDYDKVAPALLSLGAEVKFWNLAIRPGKPLLFCQRGKQKILGLPGNPISALICARLFLVPLIHKFLGQESSPPQTLRAILTSPLEKNGPRQHYMRAELSRNSSGEFCVTPQKSQDSSLVGHFAQATALIIREPYALHVEKMTEIDVLPMDF